MRLPLTLALLATLPNLALAQDAIEDRGWSGTAEFGLAIASGNADSETLNGKFGFNREADRWLYSINAAALRAESNDDLSANRYDVGGKFGYLFTEKAYLFGSFRHEDDDFASYEWTTVFSTGLGYKFIQNDTTTLTAEAGPGWRRTQPVDEFVGLPPVLSPVDAESDLVGRGTVAFAHRLTGNTSLTNDFLVESGSGSSFLQNDLGVSVQMSERYALKAGYQVRHSTEVPADLEKTDTLFTTNLVVAF